MATNNTVTTSGPLTDAWLRLQVISRKQSSASLSTLAGVLRLTDGVGKAVYVNPLYLGMDSQARFALFSEPFNNTIRRLDLATGVITTIAGGGDNSGSGSDDGVGPDARFNGIRGIAVSRDGDFALIVDTFNRTIRRIELATNTVTTIAGTVRETGSTDGIGSAARFTDPEGIALSSNGAFALVVDNQTIRHINLATKQVTTIAGGAGVEGFTNGPGSQARFGYPYGIAISGDNSFALVGENNNHAIRRLDLGAGGTSASVSTLAGGGEGSADGVGTGAQFQYPLGVAISGDGKVALVTDYYGLTVRHIDIATARVSTLAGKARGFGASDAYGSTDGPGNEARFTNPRGVTISSDGKVALVADVDNDTIRRIDIPNPLQPVGTVSTVAGAAPDTEGTRGIGRVGRPANIALSSDGDFALIANPQTHMIRRVDIATGTVTNYAGRRSELGGTTDGDRLTEAQFREPQGIAINAGGTFAVVADTANNTIRRIDLGTGIVTTVAGKPFWSGGDDGTGEAARFNAPRDVAISPDGSFALVADSANHTIRKVMLATGVVTTLAGTAGQSGSTDGTGTAARFNDPTGIALSANGAFALVADAENHTIRMIDVTRRVVTTLAGDPEINGTNDGIGADAWFQRPIDVTISTDGKTALAVDTYNGDIRRIDIGSRRVTTPLKSSWDDNALTFDPESIVLSPDGSFALVSDQWHDRIARIDLSLGDETVLREEWIAVAGNGTLARPLTLAGLTADARARGQLSLEATLFSRVPGGDAREARHILARASAPFAILDGNTSVSLGVAARTYRANLTGYAADDQAAKVELSGVVRNTSGAAGSVTLSVTRNDGAVIADQTITNLAAGAIYDFTASDPQPPTGPVTYTARTNLGSVTSVDIRVVAPSVYAMVTPQPVSIALGEATTLSALVRNDGVVAGFVTVDLGTGAQDLRLEPGAILTRTRVLTPTAAGILRQPVVFTGNIRKTETAQVTVRDETATVAITLGGTTRDATTLVQGEDAALALNLASPAGLSFDAAVDYQVTGPTARSGSIPRALNGGSIAVPAPLGTLPAGSYQVRVTVRHARLEQVLATATLDFKVVAPRYDLVLDPSTPTIDNTGTARLQIVVANATTSDRAWVGTLVLDGAMTQRTAVSLGRGASRSVNASLALRDRSGQQLIEARLLDSDGALVMQRTITLSAAPSVAPQVELTNVAVKRGTAGGEVEVTATLRNTGPAGDAMLELIAFDQTYRWLAPVATGANNATYRVPVPAGILADTYPVIVRLGTAEIKRDAAIEGAELEVRPRLDAADYAPSAQATLTVDVQGIRGGPAQYDVFLRYGAQEVTRTLTIDAGQIIPVAMAFDVGPISDRATVLMTNHPRLPSEPRFTVVIDSQQVIVREDPRAFLQTDKAEYRAGETVRLMLHLTKPVETAMILAPDNLPGIANPVLWSSLQVTQPGALKGDFPATFELPAVVRTGRYFVRFLFDGEERALPIDIFGYDVVPEQVEVTGGRATIQSERGMAPAAAQSTTLLAAGDALTVTTALRSEQALARAVITAYALAPGGDYLDLGPSATITRSLPVGLTPLTLRGSLATTEPGAHQVVVKVREAATGTVLGSEATFVDVGGGRLLSLTTDHGLYRPGLAGTGTLSLYGTEQVVVTVRTSGGDTLLNRIITPQGHTSLTFTLPTATEPDEILDEVLIATLRDSRGMTDTLQVAYKVAATLDTTAPQVTLLDPAPGSVVVFGDTARHVTLTGSVTETGGLREVLVNGMPATVHGNQWSMRLPLEWGSNLLQIVALDRAGNVGMAPPTSLLAEPGMGASITIEPTTGQVGEQVTVTALVTATVGMTATLSFPWAAGILADQGTASSGRLDVVDGVARWSGVVPAGAAGVTVRWTGRVIAPPSEPLAALLQAEGGLPRRSNAVALTVASHRSVYLPFVRR